MTWNRETSHGNEASKIAPLTVPYLQGRFLDLGCGDSPVWPSGIGVDNHGTFGGYSTGIRGDISDLSLFADGSVDAVFSSHALEDFERSRVPDVLREWTRVLKVGGNLVLYVPSANLYPRCGEEGANPRHKWDIYPGDIENILKEIGSWELLESEERDQGDEYSLFIVAKKLATEPGDWIENVWQRNPGGKKRCLLVRYGAIGDAIQTSSVFPLIKQQGYHLTVNCKQDTKEVLKHDPFVDDWIVQSTDFVPNQLLGPYWAFLDHRYDRVINLCESIEGSLLTMVGRLTHQYPDDVRRQLYGGISYLGRTHDIAGVSRDYDPQFYMSEPEIMWAKALKKAWTNNEAPIVLWAIAGSAHHKIYPWVAVVMKWLLEHTTAHVVLTGDKDSGLKLQGAIMAEKHWEGSDTGRVHQMAGRWTVRETLTMANHADVVVGPETGVLNSVSFNNAVKKVLYLSHSSKTNIGGEWLRTKVLEPDRERSPCFPCHRLHEANFDHCFQDEATMAALCAASISPQSIFDAIMTSLGATRLVKGGG